MNLRFEELPHYVTEPIREAVAYDQVAASRRALWAVILGLTPILDGNQWCVLCGENLQEGIAAFGNSPEAAMFAFEVEFMKPVKP